MKDSKKSSKNDKESVSYTQLFRYAKISEKMMVFFGVIFSILQGCTMPLMMECLGEIINIFVSIVVNTTLKSITGVNDESTLENMIKSYNNDPQSINNVGLNQTMNSIKNSQYGNYDFSNGFSFKKKNDIYSNLYKQMIILAIVGVASFIFTYLFNIFFNISAYRQATKIRSLCFSSILRQEIGWHEQTSPGELSSRIVTDAIIIEDGIGVKLGNVIQCVSQIIACYVFAFKNGWKLTLEMSVVIPLFFIALGIMSVFMAKYSKKCQDIYAEMGGIAQETFSQIRTVVSFGSENKECKRYESKLEPSRKYGIIKSHSYGLGIGIMMGLLYVSYGIAFFQGSKFIHSGEMDAGKVMKVFMNVLFGINGISNCTNSLNVFGEATGAASKLFSIIERKPKIGNKSVDDKNSLSDTSSNSSGSTFVQESPIKGVVEFKDVHFRYPSRPDVEVLKGISFSCEPGKTVALVGASGSGKSTIIQLLERFYSFEAGSILIDGKDIEDYDIHWLRTQIGLVSQEPTLFAGTIAENIAIACPNATQEQIENAAKLANAHSFIMNLSKGYQTNTGERGLQLSGGQKQRICIARALMLNPKILLLDEATSALDNQSEKVVQKALDTASAGRTTIVVAHRLTTIKNADCIIVMEKGNIIEFGTHDELMAKRNIYYNLVKNQEMKVSQEMENIESSNENTSNDESITEETSDITDLEEIELVRHNTRQSSKLKREKSTASSKVSKKSKGKKKESGPKLAMNWGRFINFNKPVWFANVCGLIGSVFNGLSQIAYAIIFAKAMNMFTQQNDDLLDTGKRWGLMFVGLGCVCFISFYAQVGGFSNAGEYLSLVFRKLMFRSLVHQEIGFFDTNDIGDGSEQASGGITEFGKEANTGTLTSKLATEASLVQSLNISLGYLMEILFGLCGGIIVALYFSWKFTLCLLLLFPLIFLGMFLQIKALSLKDEELRKVYENSSTVACEAIVSIKTVYSLNLEKHFRDLYNEKLFGPQKKMEKRLYISGIGPGISNAINYFTYALGFYLGAIFIDKGLVSFEDEMKVLMVVILSASIAGRVSAIAPNYTRSIGAFTHVLEIIDRKPKIDSRSVEGCTKSKGELKGNVLIKGLQFTYPSRPSIVVLRMGDDAIEIPEGKVCGIVGGSGCGKSTILGLIPRWYDPQQGTITIDGIKNTDYNIKYLREQIGVVNQEPMLFNISIKENILYGKQDATDEEVHEAAKKANIHDFIMSLPEGYDTLVGGIGTTQMSGGQKQRIAIARAIIRNPKILLLDEATSALDAESEIKVQEALEDASIGRTTITVAHRLSTIKQADLIVVMKNGKIAEKGTHDQLMNLKGEYYEMVLAGDDGFSK